MEYARKSAAESATATVSLQSQTPVISVPKCNTLCLFLISPYLQIQSLQTQSSRVSLAVSIQAPLIVIPVSSNSCDALVANLGHLSVSNSFKLAHDGKDPDGSDAVVVDNMVVELSSVQLLRFEFK